MAQTEDELKEEDSPSKRGVIWETLKSMIFIFGTAALTTIAVRNSVNPYIDRIWGASHDFWGGLWQGIYKMFGNNDFLVHNLGSAVFTWMCFIVFNALFLCCDITGKPSWLLKYKVQEGKNQPVDQEKLWKCIKTCSFNWVVVSPIFTLVLYLPCQYIGALHKGECPTFERVLFEFLIFSLVEEVFFYYGHRMLHHPKMYAKLHKKHHEWTAPIGISSVYCGSFEMILSNLFPAAMGPFIMRSHIFVTWLWFALVIFSTTLAHGGYHVPFLFSPESHDYHHKTFNCWFGTLGILDKLHKTDRPFSESIQGTRHYISFSLTPVSKLNPDPSNRCARPSCSAVKEE